MKRFLKTIYLLLTISSAVVFIATIELITTKYFYISIILPIVCVLSFFALIPYLSEEDIEILTNDYEGGGQIDCK